MLIRAGELAHVTAPAALSKSCTEPPDWSHKFENQYEDRGGSRPNPPTTIRLRRAYNNFGADDGLYVSRSTVLEAELARHA